MVLPAMAVGVLCLVKSGAVMGTYSCKNYDENIKSAWEKENSLPGTDGIPREVLAPAAAHLPLSCARRVLRNPARHAPCDPCSLMIGSCCGSVFGSCRGSVSSGRAPRGSHDAANRAGQGAQEEGEGEEKARGGGGEGKEKGRRAEMILPPWWKQHTCIEGVLQIKTCT
jgi:hypothetical protein